MSHGRLSDATCEGCEHYKSECRCQSNRDAAELRQQLARIEAKAARAVAARVDMAKKLDALRAQVEEEVQRLSAQLDSYTVGGDFEDGDRRWIPVAEAHTKLLAALHASHPSVKS